MPAPATAPSTTQRPPPPPASPPPFDSSPIDANTLLQLVQQQMQQTAWMHAALVDHISSSCPAPARAVTAAVPSSRPWSADWDNERFFQLVGHENDMINARMTWWLVLQGFMLAGVAFGWEKSLALVNIFATIGIITSLSSAVVLRFATYAIQIFDEQDIWISNGQCGEYLQYAEE